MAPSYLGRGPSAPGRKIPEISLIFGGFKKTLMTTHFSLLKPSNHCLDHADRSSYSLTQSAVLATLVYTLQSSANNTAVDFIWFGKSLV